MNMERGRGFIRSDSVLASLWVCLRHMSSLVDSSNLLEKCFSHMSAGWKDDERLNLRLCSSSV